MDQAARDIFKAAKERYLLIEKLHRETERDAKTLQHLIGKQILKGDNRYELTDIRNAWDGTISARGYRIKANGKRGSQVWDIGFISDTYFDDASEFAVTS
jgi:hypothetical protein